MSTDRLWRVPKGKSRLQIVREATAKVAANYAGVEVEVEQEAPDYVSIVFLVPDPSSDEPAHIELSLYDLDRDGHVLGLELEDADNHARLDEADQLAEDLADALGAEPLDL